MSEQNVEIVRRGFAALGRDDIDGMLAVVHPDIELIPLSAKLVDGVVYRGHEGVRHWDRGRRDTWELNFDPQGFEESGDRVLVTGRVRSRGHGSGVELDTPVSWVFELRDGKVVRLEAFQEEREARAAAGLRPQQGGG